MNKIKYIALFISVLLLVSCKEKSNYSKIDTSQVASETAVHKIVINEYIGGEIYGYLNVTEGDKTYWMAIPDKEVKKGETYYYNGGMLMKDFKSKQLNKVFDEIVFVEGIRSTEELLKKAPNSTQTHEKAVLENTVDEVVKVEKVANGITIEELLSGKKSYSGKEVILRGKVVKVNNGIMEKNWVHIVDGTQHANVESITITTQEIVKVGDVVTFSGKVILDKDFGYGYVYDILLEEGELIK